MQAYLFDDFRVEIDRRATLAGHCWYGRYCDGMPAKLTSDLERFFYRVTLEHENPVVFDIGANDGVFSLIAAINRHMRCFAFEPAPSNYEILRTNVAINNLGERVKTFELALADRKGTGVLKVPSSGDEDGLACIGSPLRFKDWLEFEVPVSTVDDFVRKHGIENVDLMKIDTEGAEASILEAGRDLFDAGRVDFIVMEVNLTGLQNMGTDIDGLFELARDLGFIVCLLQADGSAPVLLARDNRPDPRYVYNVLLASPGALAGL